MAAIDLCKHEFIYFDSMLRQDIANALGVLKMWLMNEANDKIGKDLAEKIGISNWQSIVNPTYLPEQHDSGSCSILVLYMANYLERGVMPDFDRRLIPTLRHPTALFL